MTRPTPALALLLAACTFAGANAQTPPAASQAKDPAWEAAVAAWKQTRFERLQRPDGWLTLVGLGWLKAGDNSIGSDPKSAVVLPAGKAPARRRR